MRVVLGIICVLFGSFGWVGQLISAVHYPLAQKLGLQEKSEGTDALYRVAEHNTAKWDAMVLWTLPVAGVLMLMNSPWWPCVALVAGGIHLDTAGREVAKLVTLKKSGVRVGTSRDMKIQAAFFSAMSVMAIWLIFYALWSLGT